jgi:cytochrome oxidase Cu insertion factor (SCO1/SenC/PrrC family)
MNVPIPTSPRRRLLAATGLLGATGLGLVLAAGCASNPGIEAADQAPDLMLTDDQGNQVSLQDRLDAGKIVVLSFYAQDDTPG